jgi:hypothetical protein
MISRRDPARAKRDSRRRIAFRRLRHDVFFRNLRQQFTHRRFLIDVRQNQEAFRRNQALQARDRLFEQRLLCDQAEQLFRTRPPA